MELTIERRWKRLGYTIGIMYVNNERFCETLEDTDRGLTQSMPVGVINQKGTYTVVLSVSAKFAKKPWAKKYKGLVPEVLNVKAFSGIRVHPGSSAKDTLGCPLVGQNKVVGGLVESQKTYYALMDGYIVPAWNKGEEITLTIK